MRRWLVFLITVFLCAEGSFSVVKAADLADPFAVPAVEQTARVPIIMYHLVTANGKYLGRYGITPGELESDLRYLQENEYTAVLMGDLIAFVEQGRLLPENPVVLTFDDGNCSDYQYLYPLLKKYNCKAVLSVMGKETDECTKGKEKYPSARYPNMTWAQIKELHESGYVEIQSHGYDVHGALGSGKRKNESLEAYRLRFKQDLSHLQTRCLEELNDKPNTFTYPLGVIGKGSKEALVEMGFSASLSCFEGVNILKTGDSEGLFRLKRCIRPGGSSIKNALERAKKVTAY